MKKYLILALMFLMTYLATSQEKISIAILQDVKLATIGDKEHNYDAFTLNFITRLKMQGNQQKYGYLIVYPEFEYANLKQSYMRYSANVGYTFNKLIVNKTEASLIGGYGLIDREGVCFRSFSITGEIGYKITKHFKIIIDAQFVQRTDIRKYVTSGFIGIEINL